MCHQPCINTVQHVNSLGETRDFSPSAPVMRLAFGRDKFWCLDLLGIKCFQTFECLFACDDDLPEQQCSNMKKTCFLFLNLKWLSCRSLWRTWLLQSCQLPNKKRPWAPTKHNSALQGWVSQGTHSWAMRRPSGLFIPPPVTRANHRTHWLVCMHLVCTNQWKFGASGPLYKSSMPCGD